MTDPTPRPDDEIVSAVLDGEATADERALVEADPAAQVRLEQLRAARDLVAAPVAVPAAARERALAAALAAFGETSTAPRGPDWVAGGSTAPTPADPAEPPAGDELAARRSRTGGSGRAGRWLAAAAAVVVVVIGAGVAFRLVSSNTELTTAANAPAASQDQTQSDPQLESGVSDPSGGSDSGGVTTTTASAPAVVVPSTTAPATVVDGANSSSNDFASVDIGSVATTGELRDRMLALVDGRTADNQAGPAPTTPPSLDESRAYATCAASITGADPEISELLAAATATIDGQRALVLAFTVDRVAFPAANGSVRIYAIDQSTCAPYTVLTVR